MTSDEVAAETTIRTRYGDTVSVRRLVSVEGGALYAAVNDDDRHIGYTFAKPEAMRFAGALLEAVGVPYFFEGRDPHPARPDRPVTLGDVDRILSALREGAGTDPERLHLVETRLHETKAALALMERRLDAAERQAAAEKAAREAVQEQRGSLIRWREKHNRDERRVTDALAERDMARAQRDEAEARRMQAAMERDNCKREMEALKSRRFAPDVEKAFALVRDVQDAVGELTDGIAGEATMKAWRQYRQRASDAVALAQKQREEASQIVRALEIERDSLRKAVAERVAERDKALTERDGIGYRLRAENDRLRDQIGTVGEPLVAAVERILDEKSAWVGAPNRAVAESIAIRAAVAARGADVVATVSPTTLHILPGNPFAFPRGRWVLKGVRLAATQGTLSLDLEPYRG